MKISRLIPAIIIVVVLGGFGTSAYLRIASDAKAEETAGNGGEEDGDSPDTSVGESFSSDVAIPVEGVAVVRDTLVLTVSAAGQAASPRQTVLRAQVSGQVRAVRIAENQAIGANAVLIEIDPTEYQLRLDEARASLRRAEGQYRELTLGDDRIPDVRVRAERDSAARAKSGLDAAHVAVTRAELDLSRSKVIAPFGGRIANLKVVVGQQVGPSDDLLTIQEMEQILVHAQVLEGEIGFLQPGRAASINFAAFPGETFQGRVQSINPVVEQATRTARVAIAVSNPQGRILPGMYARVSLPARRFPDRILVPTSAILERDRRTMLFVYNEQGSQGRAEWRYVNTGLRNDTHIEIVRDGAEEGFVEPGEVVLVSGHYTLIHDAVVRLTENASQQEGARVR
jgi:membrane fusion protein (multidrug efflux system)